MGAASTVSTQKQEFFSAVRTGSVPVLHTPSFNGAGDVNLCGAVTPPREILVSANWVNGSSRSRHPSQGFFAQNVVSCVLSMPDESTEFIWLPDVVQFLRFNEASPFLRRVYSALRDGGWTVIVLPNLVAAGRNLKEQEGAAIDAYDILYGVEQDYPHRSGWTDAVIADQLEGVGFCVIQVASHEESGRLWVVAEKRRNCVEGHLLQLSLRSWSLYVAGNPQEFEFCASERCKGVRRDPWNGAAVNAMYSCIVSCGFVD